MTESRGRRVGRFVCLAVGLVLTLATAGCPRSEPARALVRAMQEATLEQGRQTRRTVHVLVVRTFREVEGSLQARAELRRAELREEIHRLVQRRVDAVASASVAQLEAALEGPVARLDAALREEQSKPLGLRDRAREMEIAIRLSTTLAALGRESDRLVERAAERGAVARERALALVDRRVARLLAAPELDLDPDALAREVLAPFEASSQGYDQEMVEGLAELERHLAGSELALRAFARGAVGARLGDPVAARVAELLERGEVAIREGMLECRVAALAELEGTPQSGGREQ